jgi:hypothetical protein
MITALCTLCDAATTKGKESGRDLAAVAVLAAGAQGWVTGGVPLVRRIRRALETNRFPFDLRRVFWSNRRVSRVYCVYCVVVVLFVVVVIICAK